MKALRLAGSFLICVVASTPAQALDPRAVAEGLASRSGIQTSIPDGPPVGADYSYEGSPGSSSPNFEVPVWLIWLVAAIGLAFVASVLFRTLPDWNRRMSDAGVQPTGDGAAPETPLGVAQREADELAALGRFDEAMHLLLLRAVAELRRAPNASIADSLTAREIERRAPLTAGARVAFARLVRAVEFVLFARAGADAAIFGQKWHLDG